MTLASPLAGHGSCTNEADLLQRHVVGGLPWLPQLQTENPDEVSNELQDQIPSLRFNGTQNKQKLF